MIKELQIPIFDLTSSLSSAMDLINPLVANHHKQVAYISFRIATELGLPMATKKNVLLAGTLHDIGALSVKERIDTLDFDVVNTDIHCDKGYRLLRMFEPFNNIADIVRFHHVYWKDGVGQEYNGHSVPIESHIVHLADRIAVLIDTHKEIFSQVPSILALIESKKGEMFHPELFECFKRLSEMEFFWLDLVSNITPPYLQSVIVTDTLALESKELLAFAQLFSKVIDFRSPFTATHSAGVAATAAALSQFLPFSKKECFMIRIAGLFHDLGKLAIPVEILEKNSGLTPQEWNIMRRHTYYGYHILQPIEDLKLINNWGSLHHERIDGTGYPFHLRGDELSLGSRVMAVADIVAAISEDRPYRKGMSDEQIQTIIKNQASSGAIDAEISSLFINNYDEIKSQRLQAEQESLYQYHGLL